MQRTQHTTLTLRPSPLTLERETQWFWGRQGAALKISTALSMAWAEAQSSGSYKRYDRRTLTLAWPSAKADAISEQSMRTSCSFSDPRLPEYRACAYAQTAAGPYNHMHHNYAMTQSGEEKVVCPVYEIAYWLKNLSPAANKAYLMQCLRASIAVIGMMTPANEHHKGNWRSAKG